MSVSGTTTVHSHNMRTPTLQPVPESLPTDGGGGGGGGHPKQGGPGSGTPASSAQAANLNSGSSSKNKVSKNQTPTRTSRIERKKKKKSSQLNEKTRCRETVYKRDTKIMDRVRNERKCLQKCTHVPVCQPVFFSLMNRFFVLPFHSKTAIIQ